MAALVEKKDLSDDREALLEIRDVLDRSGALNWSISTPVDRWVGVTISQARVTELRLEGRQLSGTIPADLSRLSQLRKLRLEKNRLAGVIPLELGNLVTLYDISLNNNLLEGTIPESFSKLFDLRRLFLGKNRLRGEIPSSFGNLARLEKLSLLDNQLSGTIPSSLGRLSNLTLLSLGGNQLQGCIPEQLGSLSRLENLTLRKNLLTGIVPGSLSKLTNLRRLSLDNNRLIGDIPDELERLPQIRAFSAKNYNGLVSKSQKNLRSQVPGPSDPHQESTTRQKANRDEDATEFFVYILKLDGEEFYVGQTRELRERLNRHREGSVRTTFGKNPKLVWFTTVSSREKSLALESKLYHLNKNSPDDFQRIVRSFQDLVEQLDFS